MTRSTLWLSVALVFAIGCRESDSKSSSAGGSTETSTTSTSSSGPTGMGSGAGTTGTTGTGTSVSATSDAAPMKEVTTASGLKYQDLVIGTGEEATVGRTVSVHYTGWLTDGTQIDSSVGRGRPIEFPLGTTSIIQGWNEGLTGMKVGGKRHLIIPPSIGYGAAGRAPVVPPNATLIFDVELVGVK